MITSVYKRLELAGSASLPSLFEDQFQKFNSISRSTSINVLKKPNRTAEFDAFNQFHFNGDYITAGFGASHFDGNWS